MYYVRWQLSALKKGKQKGVWVWALCFVFQNSQGKQPWGDDTGAEGGEGVSHVVV